MCLITFAFNAHPKYRFILAANRDEFYNRATSAAAWWEDHQDVLGGRDLVAMGTWMGINKNGRFAAVTNYRDMKNIKPNAKTRGVLPTNFLIGSKSPSEYVRSVYQEGHRYKGFNLIVLDEELAYTSNYSQDSYDLGFGIYGLSNALLDSPWPKVEKAKSDLEYLIQSDFKLEDLVEMMNNAETATENLPNTGLDYEMEKALSAMCIRTPEYGTCCSTAITIDFEGNISFMEKSYPVGKRVENTVSYGFKIKRL